MPIGEIIDIAGSKYRIGKKLSAMEQFHVTRKLGPALVICGIGFKMVLDGVEVKMEDWVSLAGPVMDVVSKMEDKDVEYVILTCMRVCERQQGDSWAPVTTPDGKQLMFADMDQAELLRLTVEVLKMNLENFAKGMNVGANLTGESGATRP